MRHTWASASLQSCDAGTPSPSASGSPPCGGGSWEAPLPQPPTRNRIGNRASVRMGLLVALELARRQGHIGRVAGDGEEVAAGAVHRHQRALLAVLHQRREVLLI